jgi:hypothetical protein
LIEVGIGRIDRALSSDIDIVSAFHAKISL